MSGRRGSADRRRDARSSPLTRAAAVAATRAGRGGRGAAAAAPGRGGSGRGAAAPQPRARRPRRRRRRACASATRSRAGAWPDRADSERERALRGGRRRGASRAWRRSGPRSKPRGRRGARLAEAADAGRRRVAAAVAEAEHRAWRELTREDRRGRSARSGADPPQRRDPTRLDRLRQRSAERRRRERAAAGERRRRATIRWPPRARPSSAAELDACGAARRADRGRSDRASAAADRGRGARAPERRTDRAGRARGRDRRARRASSAAAEHDCGRRWSMRVEVAAGLRGGARRGARRRPRGVRRRGRAGALARLPPLDEPPAAAGRRRAAVANASRPAAAGAPPVADRRGRGRGRRARACRRNCSRVSAWSRATARCGAGTGSPWPAGAPTAAAQRLQQRNRLKALRAPAEASRRRWPRAHAATTSRKAEARRRPRAKASARRQAAAGRHANAWPRRASAPTGAERRSTRASAGASVASASTRPYARARRAKPPKPPPHGDEREPAATSPRRVAAAPSELRGQLGERRGQADRGRAPPTTACAARRNSASSAWPDRARAQLLDGARRGGAAAPRSAGPRRETIEAEIARLAALPESWRSSAAASSALIERPRKRGATPRTRWRSRERPRRGRPRVKAEEHRLVEMRENACAPRPRSSRRAKATQALTERIRERLQCAPWTCCRWPSSTPASRCRTRRRSTPSCRAAARAREYRPGQPARRSGSPTSWTSNSPACRPSATDLVNAVARLRQGINSLNREGRERLFAAFELVNEHFEKLFTRLFGGGRAHLALTEADDPLEAGLEIMASPPGKKLQVMSLLSGGEQALTATRPAVRRVPDQPGADLRAGRSRRTAGRCQRRPVLQPGRGTGPQQRRPASWSSPITA